MRREMSTYQGAVRRLGRECDLPEWGGELDESLYRDKL